MQRQSADAGVEEDSKLAIQRSHIDRRGELADTRALETTAIREALALLPLSTVMVLESDLAALVPVAEKYGDDLLQTAYDTALKLRSTVG